MPQLLTDSDINAAIEKLIVNADEYLLFISPYIKLADRLKDLLKTLSRNKPQVEVTVVFGKNETDAGKSLSAQDLEFLKELNCVKICYERRLHAKYYGSEDGSIVSSMNLHQYSQDNNIEVGIWFDSRSSLLTKNGFEYELFKYFNEVVDNAQLLYHKEAVFSSGLLGFNKQYQHSEIKTDITSTFFKKLDTVLLPFTPTVTKSTRIEVTPAKGFCIRTGKSIPFNIDMPMCAEAYQSWSQFKNMDYKEKYCHKTGQPSNGKTSMRNPILQ